MSHAKLSPSAATRWMNCPGCIRQCQGIPRKPASKYATEGSAAHYLGEKCLETGEDAACWIGRKIAVKEDGKVVKIEVTPDMAEAVQVYLDTIRKLRADMPDADCFSESKISFEHWVPEGFGTADYRLVQNLGKLMIVDYKHGAGVPVDAKGNTQMRVYALGAVGPDNPCMVETVEMMIVQPRAPHTEGVIRSDTMEVDELLKWGDEVLAPAALATEAPDAPLKAGSWCRWCDANGACPEQSKVASQAMFGTDTLPVVKEGEPKPQLPDPEQMTPEQMAQVYRIADELLEPWLKAVKTNWQRHLEDNGPAEGYKLVAGRATRKWADPLAAELEAGDLLGDDAYEDPKLKSPAQMEKVLKRKEMEKDALAHLIETSRGVSIAPETDKRPALLAKPEQMFGESEQAK